MIHGTKSNRYRNGRTATTSQSGNDILAKARKEREHREHQKLKIRACTTIQNKFRLYLFRKQWYAKFMDGILIPQMYNELIENETHPVIPSKFTNLWLMKMELNSGFTLLKKMTQKAKMTSGFFFYEMKEWLDKDLGHLSPENIIGILNTILDAIDNDEIGFHKSLDESLLCFTKQILEEDKLHASLIYPNQFYFNNYDSFLCGLIKPILTSAAGKDVVKRLFKKLITPTFAMMIALFSTNLTEFIFEEDTYEFMVPTENHIWHIRQFPIGSLEFYGSRNMGIFEPFFLCFKNYSIMYSLLIDHFVESSSLQQVHDYSVNISFEKPQKLGTDYSLKSHYKQIGIFFLSIIKIKQNDLNYAWILYHIYQRYENFIGKFPFQFLASPIFDISNAESIYKTLPAIKKLKSLGSEHFEMMFCYFYLRTNYNGYATISKVMKEFKHDQILEIPSNTLDIKPCLYLYSRIPQESSSDLDLKVKTGANKKFSDIFENFTATNFEDELDSWKAKLNECKLYVLQQSNIRHHTLEVNLDREKIESSIVKSMMSIQHTSFNVRYEDERGRGDGLRKQFLSDSLKLFFIRSKMFDLNYEKGELWPSREFFDISISDIFADESAQYVHHKPLIELAGKSLALLMFEGFHCPFKFSKAFLLKFAGRLLLKMDKIKQLEFEKNQFDHLDFLDLRLKDENLYKQLLTLTTISSNELDSMELFMEYKDCQFGSYQGMPINKQNLHFYIEKVVNYELNDPKIEMFLDHFVTGFVKIIPTDFSVKLLSFTKYNCSFLSTLISGNGQESFPTRSFIENLTFQGYSKTDSTIKYLCDILEHDMSEKDRWAFFEFVTSMSMLPIGGIGTLKPSICISRAQGFKKGINLYPVASTCVNMLILPDYQDKNELLEKIAYVVENEHRFHLD